MKLLLAAVFGILLTTPVVGQQRCAPKDIMSATLSDKFGEAETFMGLSDNAILTIWVNHETGSWSAVLTGSLGASCLVSSGSNGEFFAAPPQGDPT